MRKQRVQIPSNSVHNSLLGMIDSQGNKTTAEPQWWALKGLE